MSELTCIDTLRQTVTTSTQVTVGIGDDAAVLDVSCQDQQLIATDTLMEGVHFDQNCPYSLMGRKALAVNLSDIAAMGGTPECALVSLCLPTARGLTIGEQIMSGMMNLASEYHVSICGGDTNSWQGPIVISITITGRPHPVRGAILRHGAKPGDDIWVSGRLGNSIKGHHLNFKPRINLAKKLLDTAPISSMIDLSDGLGTDLKRICDASRVKATLFSEKVPLSSGLSGEKGLVSAFTDGEDFELLFTAPPSSSQRIKKLIVDETLTCIGTCHDGDLSMIIDKNGAMLPLTMAGFTHQLT